MVKRLMLVSISLFCGCVVAQDGEILRFVYCSDLHYGIDREFRGAEGVPADSVSRAMLRSFGLLENAVLPDDGGAEGYTPEYIHVRAQNGRPGALALVRLEALTEEGMAGTVVEYLP